MQFLISVIDDRTGLATAEEMAAIDVFNEQLQTGGNLVLARGITAPSEATLIDGRGAEVMSTEGPLHQSNEYISGFWLINAPDLAAARVIAAQGSRACNRKVELRPLLGD